MMRRSRGFDDDHILMERVSRRAMILGLGAGAVLAGLVTRLGWLQVVNGRRYAMLAQDNRINSQILPPLRGMILDRFGVPLADNTRNYRAVIIPEQAKPIKDTMSRLQQVLQLRDKEVEQVLDTAKVSRSFMPIPVRDFLTWDEVAAIEVNLPDLPGVNIEEGWARLYPFSEAAAHVIGYVGAANKDEAGDDTLLRQPGFRIGKSGMEKALESGLRGAAGVSEREVNVVGRVVRELSRRDAKNGERLTLSLDAELQQQLHTRLLQEQSAAAVVMDVHTGAVYALASAPSFDPNQFSKQLTTALWAELMGDERTPMINKAVAGQYPPGSTFKMVTALAGLEAGVINAQTSSYCIGHYMLGSMKFHCWKPDGHGTVNVNAALQHSCDVFFYETGLKLGPDRIADMAMRLGLGEKLGIELAEEQPGLMPTRAWNQKRRNQKWQTGQTLNTAIGQGDVLTTPLQLATMTARLVNGGYAVKPWLVNYADGRVVHDGKYPSLGVKPENLKLVMDGMWAVVNAPGGTAYGSRLTDLSGAQMGGKTGTAQVKRITAAMRAAGVKNENLPWKDRHHALFVGYAPADKPQYAVAVIVEHGVGGSRTAAPIAKEIMTLTLKRNPAVVSPSSAIEGDKK